MGASLHYVLVSLEHTSQHDSFSLALLLTQMKPASNMKAEGWSLFLFNFTLFLLQRKCQMRILSGVHNALDGNMVRSWNGSQRMRGGEVQNVNNR